MSGFPFRPTVAAVAVGLLSAGCAATKTTSNPRSVNTPSTTASASTSVSGRRATRCLGSRESTRRQRETAQANARRVYFSQGAKKRAALRKQRRTRYVAVQTVRNTEAAGEASCMVFDLQSGKLADTLVYDCDQVPQVGETVKFATFIATYVGG